MDMKKVIDLATVILVVIGVLNACISNNMAWYLLFILGVAMMIINSNSNGRFRH